MKSTLLALAAVLVGCASNPGAGVHLSAAEHEKAAAANDAEAMQHEAHFDPSLTKRREDCSPGGAGKYDGFGDCWTSETNPTATQLDEAREHRRVAAEHRAASRALLVAEAHACQGVSEHDRDTSPFWHRADILRVRQLTRAGTAPDGAPRVEGAVVVFRPVPTLTESALQRIVDCHIARNDAMGHEVPEMLYCPLVPRDVSAKVKETPEGLEVTIRSPDPDAAREVWRRAQLLSP